MAHEGFTVASASVPCKPWMGDFPFKEVPLLYAKEPFLWAKVIQVRFGEKQKMSKGFEKSCELLPGWAWR